MHIFITGAAGFLGSTIVHQWQGFADAKLTLLARDGNRIPGDLEHLNWHRSDILSLTPENLQGIDVVIHAAARAHDAQSTAPDYMRDNSEATKHLAQCAAEAGVRRFVFVSSVKVNGEYTQASRPFLSNDAPNPTDSYGISKFYAEQHLRAIADKSGMEWVIVRPPLLYGAQMKGNLKRLCDVIRRGWPLPFAAIRNQRSLLYVENLADALWHMAGKKEAANRIFLISDGAPVSTPDIVRFLARLVDVPARLFPVPAPLLKMAGALIGRPDIFARICESLAVDDGELRGALGWSPPFTMEAAIKHMQLATTRHMP
jgi:nucleoside-diphosphate-sugar epimerase